MLRDGTITYSNGSGYCKGIFNAKGAPVNATQIWIFLDDTTFEGVHHEEKYQLLKKSKGTGEKANVHEGDFFKDEMNEYHLATGRARLNVISSNLMLEGNIQNGKFEGKGRLEDVDKKVSYKGTFKDGVFYAEDRIIFQSGIMVTGQVSHLAHLDEVPALVTINGPGTVVWNGCSYEGEIDSNVFYNRNQIIYPDGRCLQGQEKGQVDVARFTLNGPGRLIWFGKSYDGTFVNQDLYSQKDIFYHDGSFFNGLEDQIPGCRSGFGILYDVHGFKQLETIFKDGSLHGKGEVFLNGNLIQKGTFHEGILVEGSITRLDGKIEEGVFVNGMLQHGTEAISNPLGGKPIINRILNGQIVYD